MCVRTSVTKGVLKGCSMFWCFVYLFTGLCLAGLGVWLLLYDKTFQTRVMLNPDLDQDGLPWLGIVAGTIALGGYCFVSGIVGMAGTGCMDRGTLIAFTVLASIGTVAAIVLAGFTTAAFALDTIDGLYEEDTDAAFVMTLKDNLLTYYTDENSTDDFTVAWNTFQINSQCCGVDGYSDYLNKTNTYNITAPENFTAEETGSQTVPWSCCVTDDTDDVTIDNVLDIEECLLEVDNPGNFTFLNPTGCGVDIVGRYREDYIIVMATTWASVILQVVALSVSGCMRINLKSSGFWTPDAF